MPHICHFDITSPGIKGPYAHVYKCLHVINRKGGNQAMVLFQSISKTIAWAIVQLPMTKEKLTITTYIDGWAIILFTQHCHTLVLD